MVRMGSYNFSDGFQDFRHEVDQCHLAYLSMDENSEKIEQRTKLEGNCKQSNFQVNS